MSGVAEKSAEWIYRGIWRVLVDCFRVPDMPPSLPTTLTSELRVFHPSRRYLAYMKLYFWTAFFVVDVAILIGWLILYSLQPALAWALAIPALIVAIVPDIIAYIAIHLRYDTIWYAVSKRGVHLRRGIIVIAEHTISLANIQNVSVTQGPVEQLFGIATLVIETAGAAAEDDPASLVVGNRVIMVGLEDVDQLREVLLCRIRMLRTSGLGDELDRAPAAGWSVTDVALLREIRDELASSLEMV